MTRHLQAHELLITIDRSRRASVGRQIEDQLREAIRAGRLHPGSELPSTRALADDLSVSRGVIERTYAQLSAEGYISVRQGASPRVREGATPGEPEPARHLRFDLRPHMPDVGAFPRHEWQRSFRTALAAARDADLGYTDPAGIWELRLELAAYLGRAHGLAVDPGRVLVTGGSTQSISLVARALAGRQVQAIGFENPSQRVHHAVVERAGVPVVGIDVDRDGIDVARLWSRSPGAVVVAPGHQFPTGAYLSQERRAAIVEFARERDAFVIEDDYDAGLRYDREPTGALQAVDPERVVYLGSTSKTLAPGLRLGWAVLPDALFGAVREELELSTLQVSALLQLAFADFLCRGEFARHVRRMRTLYRHRRNALVHALERRLAKPTITGVAAGLHLVVEVESFEQEATIVELARPRRCVLESLSDHALPGYAGPPGILVGYGMTSDASIPDVAQQLAEMIEQAKAGSSRTSAKRIA